MADPSVFLRPQDAPPEFSMSEEAHYRNDFARQVEQRLIRLADQIEDIDTSDDDDDGDQGTVVRRAFSDVLVVTPSRDVSKGGGPRAWRDTLSITPSREVDTNLHKWSDTLRITPSRVVGSNLVSVAFGDTLKIMPSRSVSKQLILRSWRDTLGITPSRSVRPGFYKFFDTLKITPSRSVARSVSLNAPSLRVSVSGTGFAATVSILIRAPVGGATPTGYELQRDTSNVFTNPITYTYTGIVGVSQLLARQVYYYRVRATRGTTKGPWSITYRAEAPSEVNQVPVWVSIPPQSAKVGDADTILDVAPFVSDANHSDSELRISLSGWDTRVVRASVSGRSITLDWGTRVGVTTITVTATDPDGATGSTALVCTLGVALPGTAGLSVTGSEQSATATVSAPATGGPVVNYVFQRSTSSRFSSVAETKGRNTPGSVTFSSLSTGTHYFRVRAVNESGNGSWSTVRSYTASAAARRPGAPGVSASASSSAVTVSVSAGSGGTPTEYRVQLATNSSFRSGLQTKTRSSPGDVVFSGLSPDTYYIRAYASNSAGTSSASSTRTATVTPAAPGKAGLTAVFGSGAITATATAPTSGGTPTTYRFQRSTSTRFTLTETKTRTSAGSVVFDNPAIGNNYIRVRAENAGGSGEWSDVRTVNVVVQSNTPGLAVMTLGNVFGTSPNAGISVGMGPPSSWTTANRPTSYRVQMARNSSFTGTVVTLRATSLTGRLIGTVVFRNLSSGTYHFRGRAENSNGNGSWTATQSATVASVATRKSQSFSATFERTALAGGGVELAWLPNPAESINNGALDDPPSWIDRLLILSGDGAEFYFSIAPGPTGTTAGGSDMVSSWETGVGTTVIRIGSRELVLDGPGVSATWDERSDTREIYRAVASSGSTMDSIMSSFISGIGVASTYSATVTLYWT